MRRRNHCDIQLLLALITVAVIWGAGAGLFWAVLLRTCG